MRRTLTCAFVLALALLGCAETKAPSRNDPVPPACEGRQFSLTVPDPPTAVRRLEYAQTGTVTFQYADCDGHPLAGYQVNFNTVGATGGSVLLAASDDTDAAGMVTATVQSKDAEADFDVTASALRAPAAAARISVRSKAGGDVEVRLIYRGRKVLSGARVLALTAPVDCEVFEASNPPSALEFKDLSSLRERARFTLQGAPSVAIAAYATGATNTPTAQGCAAGPFNVTDGGAQVVEVELEDIPPSYSGTYDVTNNFNLVEALPEGVAFYIQQLGSLFQDPGGTVVQWLVDAGLPIPQLAVSVIADLANAAFEEQTEGTALGDAFDIGAEVDDILQRFEIASTLFVKAEPTEAGLFVADSLEERWDAVVVDWSYGCADGAPADCAHKEYSWAETGLDPVSGFPTGSVSTDDPFKLTIDPHGLRFDYGAVAMWVIEKIVLPRVVGYESFTDFIYELLGGKGCLEANATDAADDTGAKVCCRAFSERDLGAMPASIARTGCVSAVPVLVDAVKGRVETLEADSGDNMTIGTKNSDGSVDKPCTLWDEDGDLHVEAMGLPPAKRCEWQVEIQRGEGEPIDFTGAWHGVRQ